MSRGQLVLSCLGIAVLSYVGGWYEWIAPAQPPFSGRLAWFYKATFSNFGTHGAAYVLWAGGTAMVVLAIANWLHSNCTNRRKS